jgi:hypothetical protein
MNSSFTSLKIFLHQGFFVFSVYPIPAGLSTLICRLDPSAFEQYGVHLNKPNIASAPSIIQLFGGSSDPNGGKFLFAASLHQHFGSLNGSLVGWFREIQKLYGII